MRPAGDARKTNVGTASLIMFATGSVAIVAAVEEGATAGEAVDRIETETSIEVVEGDLIGEAPDIQDPHHAGVTPEIVGRSGTYQDPIHTYPVGGDETIAEGLQLQTQSRLRLFGPCRTRAPPLAGGIDHPQGLVHHLGDGGPDLQIDVAPTEIQLLEEEGEAQIAELGGGHARLQTRPRPALRAHLEGEDLPQP
jgi:hypothetical protein